MKHLLFLLSLFLCFNVEAQRKTFYASDFPELIAANGAKQVKDFWPTTAQAEARLPNAYKWWTIIAGQTPASFLTMNIFPACENEAIWAGNGSGFAPGNQCTSRNSFDASGVYGKYEVNVACRINQGKLIGAGTSIGSDKGNASTELHYDHARWQDPAPIRAVILSTNWGTSDYLESVFITGFRITGSAPGWYDPSYTEHGIAVRMLGETAAIERCYVNDHNGNGIWVNGSGPGHIQHVSCFDNNLAGIYVTNDKTGGTAGNSLGMLTIMHCSFDNNGYQILNIRGGAMAIFYIKSEYALSATRGKPNKAGPIVEAHGWNDITIDHITDSHGSVPAGAAFVFETTANVSRVTINHYSQIATNDNVNIGRSALISDPRAKKVWQTANPNTAKYNPLTIDWRASGNSSTVTCTEPLVESVFNGTTRLGIASTYAGYNYAAGTPVWDPTGGAVTPPPPGPCDWVPTTTCTACVNNSRTCTTTHSLNPAGCTPTVPKPADVVVPEQCGTVPPPTTGGIDPNDVLVVWNTADARTQAWATAYATAWGIPAANIMSVNGGTAHDCGSTIATAIRTAIHSKGKQYAELCWEYPSRVGAQSITSLVTFGPRNVSSLTTSAVYNYVGYKPRTDKGVTLSAWLGSDKYIRRDAHGTRPQGQAISHLANDQTGTPRGSARADQRPTGVRIIDSRNNPNIGKGENVCNCISNDCYVSANKPGTTPIVAAYQSNYVLLSPGNAVFAKGFYGDHLTSFGGYIPGGAAPKYLNGQNQTALTYHLDKGASFSVGSVSEPSSSLPQQFVDIRIFHPLFMGGTPVGVAAWASVKCPDRMLMAGDLMCAPFK